jgi:hypothetical protein
MSKAMIRSLLLLPLLLLLLWADTVFVATVISKSAIVANNENVFSVRLASEQVFRGDLGGREVEVLTTFSGASCGFPFEIGKQYLVYATRWEKDQKLYTGICTRKCHSEPMTITLTEKKPPLIKLTLTSPGFMHHDDEQRRLKN